MPNDYFQFKQFRIGQAGAGQRVSTDACVLGAAADLTGATRLLDVGTGTGLLALMAAQRAPMATIEAIEPEPVAAALAAANAAASPWAGRVRVHPLALADYAATLAASPGGAEQCFTTIDRRFSHILCNPPFFQRSLPSAGPARATARHAGATSLTFEELAGFAAGHLLAWGRLAVLLPPPEMAEFAQAAGRAGLAPLSQLVVRHRAGGRATRCVGEFGPAPSPKAVAERELVIEAAPGRYSSAFRQLLQAFYLKL